MKDLHTHALPGIDDGAKNPKAALEMLEDSFCQGVRLCALTPHCVIHNKQDIKRFIDNRERSYEELKEYIGEKMVPELVLGAEVYADHDISAHEDISKLCIGQSKYILMELPFAIKYGWVSDCVYSLNLKGITVIVAHLDRYPKWEEIVTELRGLKVVYEISAPTFLTISGRRLIKKIAQRVGQFIISSDMHNTTTRRCEIKKAFEHARKMSKNFGDGYIRTIDIDGAE